MPSPPWGEASSEDLYFVLLTGANSGVGVGIGERIIEEFLASRPPTSHLILIPTTRSKAKSRDTVLALRRHLHEVAHSAKSTSKQDPEAVMARVHVLSVQVDLCDLRSIYAAADQLVHGQISDPTGVIAEDVRIPRIDAALFNAGLGGWEGLDWLEFARQFFTLGLIQSTTYPSFKKALPAAILDSQKLLGLGKGTDTAGSRSPPALAEVFCANTFGHYVLAHELLPLLCRSTANETPGRVVWTSSIDAGRPHLDFADFQASRYMAPYESSKRITDLVALTAELPDVRRASASFFAPLPVPVPVPTTTTTNNNDDDDDGNEANPPPLRSVKPHFYLAHPGIVCTPMFPLNWFLFFWYWVTMHLSRLCGSPWHTVDVRSGACATSWLALAAQDELDSLGAERVKWGSAVDRAGRAKPKRTEVEGWGWDGVVDGEGEGEEKEKVERFLRKSVGRKWDAKPLTREERDGFEEDGRKCWEELERLRIAWEEALGRRK